MVIYLGKCAFRPFFYYVACPVGQAFCAGLFFYRRFA